MVTANQSTPATTPVRTPGMKKTDDTLSAITDFLTNKQKRVDESMTPSRVFALDIANELGTQLPTGVLVSQSRRFCFVCIWPRPKTTMLFKCSLNLYYVVF